tara:strand:+ start:3746 stop:4996 length:1251 start_codon:yes stop_codon:yes gene_type:complete
VIEELANGNAAFVDLKVKELDENQLKDLGHLLLHYGCIVLKKQDLELKDFSRLSSAFGHNQYKLVRDNIIDWESWIYGDELKPNDPNEVIQKAKRSYLNKNSDTKFEQDGIKYGTGLQYHNENDLDYLNPMGWFNSDFPWIQEVSGRPRGLFGIKDLVFHTNLTNHFTHQYGNLVSLYGVQHTKGSITPVSNVNRAYSDFTQEQKDKSKILRARIGRMLQFSYDDPQDVARELVLLDAGQITESKYSAVNHIKKLYSDSTPSNNTRRIIKAKELGAAVPSNKGIDIPFIFECPIETKWGKYTFSSMAVVEDMIDDSQFSMEIFDNYIDNDKYRYDHEWEDGDIIIFDQLLTIHARNNANTLNPSKRILWRSCQNHSKLGVPLWLDINKPIPGERLDESNGLSLLKVFTHLPNKELD